MLSGLTDIGTLNAEIAERFARRERITITGGSLRGDRGRRIQFWPVMGRARQMIMAGAEGEVFAAGRARPAPMPETGGVVEWSYFDGTSMTPAPLMPQLALPVVLQSVAAELMHLADIADGLGVCQAGNSEQWQSLDRMSQHLGELANSLVATSCVVPDLRPDLADALTAIRVGKLVCRLTASPVIDEEEHSGELEMF